MTADDLGFLTPGDPVYQVRNVGLAEPYLLELRFWGRIGLTEQFAAAQHSPHHGASSASLEYAWDWHRTRAEAWAAAFTKLARQREWLVGAARQAGAEVPA